MSTFKFWESRVIIQQNTEAGWEDVHEYDKPATHVDRKQVEADLKQYRTIGPARYIKRRQLREFTLKELNNWPNLHEGHFYNTKVEIKNSRYHMRVLLSRMTKADGADYDNKVTVERYTRGNWETISEYQAK